MGDSKSRILSRVFESHYPLAITSYQDEDTIKDVGELEDDVFQYLQEERLSALLSALTGTLMKQVVRSMAKVMEVGEVSVPPTTSRMLLQEMVRLGEREPYGVRGGTLVVLFVDRLGHSHRIGQFPLDPATISTYELQLALYENTQIKVKLAKLVRRLSGQPQQLEVDTHFQLRKKKLYRSSSSSSEEFLW